MEIRRRFDAISKRFFSLSLFGFFDQKNTKQIWSVRRLSKYVSVKALVGHIDRETAAAYKGTMYSETYRWFHDALSVLTDAKCVKWMKEEGFYDHWTLQRN